MNYSNHSGEIWYCDILHDSVDLTWNLSVLVCVCWYFGHCPFCQVKRKTPLKVEHFRNLFRIGSSSSVFYHQNIETDPVSKTLWIFQPEIVDIDHNIYHVQSILSWKTCSKIINDFMYATIVIELSCIKLLGEYLNIFLMFLWICPLFCSW